MIKRPTHSKDQFTMSYTVDDVLRLVSDIKARIARYRPNILSCVLTRAVRTRLSSWGTSAVWTHSSAVVTQFTISCGVDRLRLVTSDSIMTSLLKMLSPTQSLKPLWSMESVWSVSKLMSTESVGSRCELVANSVHMVCSWYGQLSRVGGVYWAFHWKQCVWFCSRWRAQWECRFRRVSVSVRLPYNPWLPSSPFPAS